MLDTDLCSGHTSETVGRLMKHRTHKRKVKECRHLPSAQDRDPEVADLMPLTAKGHERDTSVLQGLE